MARQAQLLLTPVAVGGPLAVGLLKVLLNRITQPGSAQWPSPKVWPSSCIASFKARPRNRGSSALGWTEQQDDTGFSAWLGNAKDEVQVIGVEVHVSDGEHALSPHRKRHAEQGIGMELTAPGIERAPRQRAPPGPLDIETHALEVPRQVVEDAAIRVAHRQQGDARHASHEPE
jgi:hypothetical protein